jgi:hypothetical protein
MLTILFGTFLFAGCTNLFLFPLKKIFITVSIGKGIKYRTLDAGV